MQVELSSVSLGTTDYHVMGVIMVTWPVFNFAN